MQKLGHWYVLNNDFIIEIADVEFACQEKCIYAFMKGETYIRIGSSKAPLTKRLREWERDVSNSLKGKKSQTPQKEAAIWKEKDSGELWARPGTTVETPVGTICTYLDEESALIGRHHPICNHSKHR